MNQPSWTDRAKAENQRSAEAFQRGGMGEIARQLATDTTEAQDLAGGFSGNIRVATKGLTGFVPGTVLAPEYANPKLRAKAEALHGKYPQYAEDYPNIGPPELMSKLPDPKNPGKFLSKATSLCRIPRWRRRWRKMLSRDFS